MRYITGQEIIAAFEQYSPKSLAMEGDKIGLQIGTLQKQVKKVMVTLDVLEPVVDEAIANEVDLIIAHHPIIYRPLKDINTAETAGRVIEKLIKFDIAVYVAHTNLDVAKGGVNDLLAEALQLKACEVLVPLHEDKLKKLVVFAPVDHAEKVRQAIGDSGAGHIGNYSHCSFQTGGYGMFLPNESANPFIGENSKIEKVEEVRIETIFPVSMQQKVIQSMLQAHPYEEPAFDIYPLENKGEILGLGRIGEIEQEMSLGQFVEVVKEALEVNHARVVGNLDDKVKKVAVLGGDGNKYLYAAKRSGADVFITGDLYYHTAHDAQNIGLSVIDPGHNVEKVMKQGVKRVLEEYVKKNRYDTKIIASAVHTDPFQFM